MHAEGRLHSMEPRERKLALEVIGAAWQRLAAQDEGATETILAAVRSIAAALPGQYDDVSEDFAQHIAEAAVWYLDRATRRVGDPERDGLTAAQRGLNLAHFGAQAAPEDVERLFAVAAALNTDDV
jgi:hypothetical protein